MVTKRATQPSNKLAFIPNIFDLDMKQAYSGQVSISPEDAALLLPEYNVRNRRLRSGLVEYLSRQIKNHEWQPDHPQPIVFSVSSRMIDGQHRLHAIANSGMTVYAMVTTGVRDELREYIDTGISRGLEDRVEFSTDHGENKRIATLVNQWYLIERWAHKYGRPTPAEALTLFASHKPAFVFVANLAGNKKRGVTVAPVLVALAQMHERDDGKAEQFRDSLTSVDGDVQPARRLREYLISHASMSSGAGQMMERYSKAVSAMKAAMEGRHVTILRAGSW